MHYLIFLPLVAVGMILIPLFNGYSFWSHSVRFGLVFGAIIVFLATLQHFQDKRKQ